MTSMPTDTSTLPDASINNTDDDYPPVDPAEPLERPEEGKRANGTTPKSTLDPVAEINQLHTEVVGIDKETLEKFAEFDKVREAWKAEHGFNRSREAWLGEIQRIGALSTKRSGNALGMDQN